MFDNIVLRHFIEDFSQSNQSRENDENMYIGKEVEH